MKIKKELIQQIKKLGADIVGFCKLNDETRQYIQKDYLRGNKDYKSIIVVGLHIEDPFLDAWSYFDDTRPLSFANEYVGNITTRTCLFLERRDFHSVPVLYSTVLCKDAAAVAKIGVIGKNNLLITPEFGPQVRFRAILTEAEFPDDDRILDNPCETCEAPCIKACPANAFDSGKYDRDTCYEYASNNLKQISSHSYLWCRECELACPVGI